MTIAAVMATRFDPPEREPLLETLRADGVLPVVMADVGPHAEDWSLYRIWNAGVRYAIERGADYICVLNDDVAIGRHTLQTMANFLEERSDVGVVYPDVRGIFTAHSLTPTEGTWGAGGMTGFCFMFRADLDVPFDEGYRLWYGDDAFEAAVRAKGLLVARIDGLPIDHTPMGSTRLLPDEEAQRMIASDRKRWENRTHYSVQREAVTA